MGGLMSTHAIDTTFQENDRPMFRTEAEVDAYEEALSKQIVIPPERPLSLVEQAIDSAKDFDRLKASLLDPKRHVNNIGGKDRVNAGGWQVIGAALGVKVEIISKNSQGTPGAFREVLEDGKGKKVVSFSITVRATAGTRVQERTGRCDSSETKHSQYEHKMESVAFTRAFNRAVCAIVGGEPGDNAEDAEENRDYGRAEQPQGRKQYPTAMLITLHREKGLPEGSLGKWLTKHVPKFHERLTQEQSVTAYEKLQAL